MVKRRITNIILCLGIILSSFAVPVTPVHADDGFTHSSGSFSSDDKETPFYRVSSSMGIQWGGDYKGKLWFHDNYVSIPSNFGFVEFFMHKEGTGISPDNYRFVSVFVTKDSNYRRSASQMTKLFKQMNPIFNDDFEQYNDKSFHNNHSQDVFYENVDAPIHSSYMISSWDGGTNGTGYFYNINHCSQPYALRYPSNIKVYDVSDIDNADIAKRIAHARLIRRSSIDYLGNKLVEGLKPDTTLPNWVHFGSFSEPSVFTIGSLISAGYDSSGYFDEIPLYSESPKADSSCSCSSVSCPAFPSDYAKEETLNNSTNKIMLAIQSLSSKFSSGAQTVGDWVKENSFNDFISYIKDWLVNTYKDLTAKLQAWFNDVYKFFDNIQSDISKAASDIVDAIKNIPTAVSSGGKSIWDFLTAIVDAITHIADRIADGITSIIGGLFKGLGAIFVPSSDQVSELKLKVSDLKAQTGFFAQSVDVVKDVSKQVSDGLVKGDNTIKWSDISLFEHVIIPAGSVSLDEYSSSLGISAIHTLIKTLLSGILAWNTILFVYRRFRKVFKI